MAKPSPDHPRDPAPAKKAWIIGDKPGDDAGSGEEAFIYTGVLRTGQPRIKSRHG
jgi:hypothetical protein